MASANPARPTANRQDPGVPTRRLAIDALIRIERDGAFANILLGSMLEKAQRSQHLGNGDRRLVTQLVYGTTRMKRACDHLVDRFLLTEVDDQVRAALRVGAYQLAFLATPTHAAVSATVGAVSGKGRSLVNAVLRRVAEAPVDYPNAATELSYPDWIYDLTLATFGSDAGLASLAAMNEPAATNVRDDGYIQDEASQLVVKAVGALPGELVLDVCAAPGGKATGLAATGATVIASDRRKSRVGLIVDNTARLDSPVHSLVADGRQVPVPDGVADRVLVDAPCSGLGSLRRRADARWRIEPEAPTRLAELQGQLLDEAVRLLKPGGTLVYSVCTFGPTEGADVVSSLRSRHRLDPQPLPCSPWLTASDDVAVLAPGDADGMMLARFTKLA